MQEESAIRLEQIRRATEEQIQEQRRQTEKERSDIVRETIKLKAMSEAQARILETKETEDVKRRLLVDQIKADREKWIEVINTTFEHIGGMPYRVNSFLLDISAVLIYHKLFLPICVTKLR